MGVDLAAVISQRQDDVVMVLVKFEHNMHAGNLMRGAECHRFGGTKEIRGFGGAVYPNTAVFEIKACVFLLEQNPHRGGNASSTVPFRLARYNLLRNELN